MPKATYEQGTELLLDSETISLTNATWADLGGSDVIRQGPLVTLCLRLKNLVGEAWEKKKYKEGEFATEGGHLYRAEGAGLVAKETDENKPSTKPTQWKDVGAVTAVALTLPAAYRPAATVKDATTARIEVKENGEVKILESIAASAERAFEVSYRAASVSP